MTRKDSSCTHEATIGGNGYALCDVEVQTDADPACQRDRCEYCHDDFCCLGCDQADAEEDANLCASCASEQREATAEREAEAREALRERIWSEALHGLTPLELRGNIRRDVKP